MTRFVVTNLIGFGTQVNLGSSEDLLVNTGIVVGNTDTFDPVILGTGNSHDVVILGTALGTITLGDDAGADTANSIRIGAAGTADGGSSRAISLVSAASHIQNLGTVTGFNGILLGGGGTGTSRIFNAGTISGEFRVIGRNDAATETILVQNGGTILGLTDTAIAFDSGSVAVDIIENRGVILGRLAMGGGADRIDNRGGRIEGDIGLGEGADVFDNRGGIFYGTVFGETGTDTFLLGQGIEVIDGGADFDAIDFRGTPAVQLALDDSIVATGHAAGDEYAGIEGIYGSYFADLLVGNAGANTLRGYGGNDTLQGGVGSDKIVGGRGIDALTGGAGSDVFVFDSLSEVGDTITDFGSAAGNNDLFNIRASAFGGGLVAGSAITAAQFVSRADNVAQDASDRFIFRTTDRTLWFDADGNGAGAAVMVADLQAGATVDRTDIILI